jgi:hypothetical protein
MVLGRSWGQMESEQISSFSLEFINLNKDCVKTIFISLYLFVRSQTSLDHLMLSSEARRYLTLIFYIHMLVHGITQPCHPRDVAMGNI